MTTNGCQINWQSLFKGSSLMAVMKFTASKTVVKNADPPFLHLPLMLPFLEQRGEMPMRAEGHVVNVLLKEDSFRLDCTLQDLEV
jgi:hypothetical protein